jgi:hypothetical protein
MSSQIFCHRCMRVPYDIKKSRIYFPERHVTCLLVLQKRVVLPSLIIKEPFVKTSSLIFISPLQKWESYGLALTYVRDLDLRYLFLSKSCHMPSIFSRLTIHLANKHLFCNSSSRIPNPPWSLGRQRMSHLVSLYLCLFEDLCQKNI